MKGSGREDPIMPSSTHIIDTLSPEEEECLLKELQSYCSPNSSGEITEEGLQEIIHRWGWPQSPNHRELKSYDFFFELLLSEKLTVGMVNAVLYCFPEAARMRTRCNKTALHIILLSNEVVTLSVVQILVDADPPSIAHKDAKNLTVLHCLCNNVYLNASARLEILNFLIQTNRGLLEIASRNGRVLPIHYAAGLKSTPVPFMQTLIDASPAHVLNSLTASGVAAIHIACFNYNLHLVKTLVNADPNCLNLSSSGSSPAGYPIHSALTSSHGRGLVSRISVVRFLVNFPGSTVVSQEFRGYLPLHMACLAASKVRGNNGWDTLERYLPNDLEIIKILFDAFPGAIKHSRLRRDMKTGQRGKFHPKVMEFINHHYTFALPYNLLKKRYNPLPLHSAIMKKECLGSIKLLVEGNPTAVFTPDSDGAIPLHLAVQHHSSSEVIRFLIRNATTLAIADLKGSDQIYEAAQPPSFTPPP
eukprot:scaffold4260_cov81-Skeletonema_menzelii.AAC.2